MVRQQGADNSFGAGLVCSLALHVLTVALALMALPRLLSPPPEIQEPVPVELVDISEKTAPPPRQVETPEPEPTPPPPPPKPEPEPPPSPIPPEPPRPTPPPEPEPAPIPLPLPKPKPPEPVPPPKPDLLKDLKPPPKKPPPPPDDFDNLLKSVNKLRQTTPSPPAATPTNKTVVSPLTERAAQPTVSERDFVAAQIWPRWNVDLGAKGAETLKMAVKISVLPDGTVTRADLEVDAARYASDGFYRAAADAAKRAVLSASPLKWPLSRPDLFRANPDMTINFDPRSMMR